jgi:hypothetical protein
MIVTIQIQIDPTSEIPPREIEFTNKQLEEIRGEMYNLRFKLEKLGYVRCQMCADGKSI